MTRSTGRRWIIALALVVLSPVDGPRAAAQRTDRTEPDWGLNATVMETCSCPTFCQCYFMTTPAAHHDRGTVEHYCRFNRALKINRGHFGKTVLDGVKFWMAGDLGGDFSKEHYDWALLTFESSLAKEGRDALVAIAHHVFPGTWNSFGVAGDAVLRWTVSPERATAALDGGRTAEIALRRPVGMAPGPVVIRNLKYEGAPRNDGFIVMPNEVEAYRIGAKAFEFKGTNGFMTTIDMSSKDLPR
jgi:hypothetical protein